MKKGVHVLLARLCNQPYNRNNSPAAFEDTPCNQTVPVWFTHSSVTHWKWLTTDEAQSNVSRSEIHIQKHNRECIFVNVPACVQLNHMTNDCYIY